MFLYISSLRAYRKYNSKSWQTLETNKISETNSEAVPQARITSVANKTIIYEVDIIHKELLKIHDKLYEKRQDDQCEVRDPACVILGVAKSGTQELVDFASLHPHIILKPGLASRRMFDLRKDVRRHALLKEGKSPLPCSYSDQTVVLKSDDFLYDEEMPKILHRFNPKLKMILITREPVSRMISGFSFKYFQLIQRREKFVFKPEMLPEMDHYFINVSSGKVHERKEQRMSTYYTGMEHYLKIFPLNQILVLEANEFKDNPVKVLQRVEKFLDIKPVITDDFFTYVDEKGFYCLNSDQIYCYGSDRGRKLMKDLKPETMKILRDYFKPFNTKFFDQIGRDFDW
ncbi:Heparan sulfate glucosamine 3-O-sulfotransferase 1 [Mactra antiquata]